MELVIPPLTAFGDRMGSVCTALTGRLSDSRVFDVYHFISLYVHGSRSPEDSQHLLLCGSNFNNRDVTADMQMSPSTPTSCPPVPKSLRHWCKSSIPHRRRKGYSLSCFLSSFYLRLSALNWVWKTIYWTISCKLGILWLVRMLIPFLPVSFRPPACF